MREEEEAGKEAGDGREDERKHERDEQVEQKGGNEERVEWTGQAGSRGTG